MLDHRPLCQGETGNPCRSRHGPGPRAGQEGWLMVRPNEIVDDVCSASIKRPPGLGSISTSATWQPLGV